MNFKERVFRKESLARYLDSDKKFSKQLGAFDLITMGIGIVIGTGIFILPGTVAAMHSGPAIILSFVVAAVVCSLAAMCYAEFSSALPVAGFCIFFWERCFRRDCRLVFGMGLDLGIYARRRSNLYWIFRIYEIIARRIRNQSSKGNA